MNTSTLVRLFTVMFLTSLLYTATLQSANASGTDLALTMTDSVTPAQVLPPGTVGPPQPQWDNITYGDANAQGTVQSWEVDIQIWDVNYQPSSGTDTNNVNPGMIDSGTGPSTPQTKKLNVLGGYIYAWFKASGTYWYNFKNAAFDTIGNKSVAVTGPISLVKPN